MLYSYPSSADFDPSEFLKETPTIAKYGLPLDVQFCKSCVISNQRPSSSVEHKNDGKQPKKPIGFNDLGVCDACSSKDIKQQTNWKEREEQLRELCDRFRKNDGS